MGSHRMLLKCKCKMVKSGIVWVFKIRELWSLGATEAGCCKSGSKRDSESCQHSAVLSVVTRTTMKTSVLVGVSVSTEVRLDRQKQLLHQRQHRQSHCWGR